MGLFTKRSSVLGLPVGSKKPNWSNLAKAAAGTAAAVGAGKKAKDAASSLGGKGKKAVEKAKDVRDKADGLTDAIGGSSTTIGKATSALKEVSSWTDGNEDDNLKKQRLIIRERIDVGVPRRVAYNQWTQFEDFPSIFHGVESVEQKDDETTVWHGKIGPSKRRWTARITEQDPDERIKWITKGGVNHRGVVTFHSVDDNLTRVMLEMEYYPRGVVEKFANLFLTARHRVRKDLKLFKHFIELEGEETGAWRGEISKDDGDNDDNDDSKNKDDDKTSDKDSSADSESDSSSQSDDGEPARDDDGRFISLSEGNGNGKSDKSAKEKADA